MFMNVSFFVQPGSVPASERGGTRFHDRAPRAEESQVKRPGDRARLPSTHPRRFCSAPATLRHRSGSRSCSRSSPFRARRSESSWCRAGSSSRGGRSPAGGL